MQLSPNPATIALDTDYWSTHSFIQAATEPPTMLPAQRQSHGRTRRRRAHDSLTVPTVGICPLSSKPKLPHQACVESGYARPGLRIKVRKLKIGVDPS